MSSHEHDPDELDSDACDSDEPLAIRARPGLMTRLREMPLADLSIVLAIILMIHLIPSVLVLNIVRNQGGDFTAGMIVGIATWVAPVALIIWKVAPKKESAPPNTDLRVFHTLPAVLLAALIVRGTHDAAFIRTLFNFVDFVLLFALLAYGFLCLRLWIRPPLAYPFYLAGSAASFLVVLSRL